MKHPLILLVATAAVGLYAQTNILEVQTETAPAAIAEPAVTSTNSPAARGATMQLDEGEIVIESDRSNWQLKSRFAVFTGNVVVIYPPQLHLTCDAMTARLSPNTGRFESMEAEGNVVVDATDRDNNRFHATCQKLVYTNAVIDSVTNELVIMTGDPVIKRASDRMGGTEITMNLTTGGMEVINQRALIQPETLSRTNRPAAAPVPAEAKP